MSWIVVNQVLYNCIILLLLLFSLVVFIYNFILLVRDSQKKIIYIRWIPIIVTVLTIFLDCFLLKTFSSWLFTENIIFGICVILYILGIKRFSRKVFMFYVFTVLLLSFFSAHLILSNNYNFLVLFLNILIPLSLFIALYIYKKYDDRAIIAIIIDPFKEKHSDDFKEIDFRKVTFNYPKTHFCDNVMSFSVMMLMIVLVFAAIGFMISQKGYKYLGVLVMVVSICTYIYMYFYNFGPNGFYQKSIDRKSVV